MSESTYAVRVGIHGQVGRFTSASEHFRRRSSVICRTARGVEIGRVLNPIADHAARASNSAIEPEETARPSELRQVGADGKIVRRMTVEDQLLWNNLQQLAAEAHSACQQWLINSGSIDQLLDVEPLLDGRTLYFHFLNTASAQTDAHLEQLVNIFQATVASSSFAHLLEAGCGPGCGTAAAINGCGAACHSCAVSKACAVKR